MPGNSGILFAANVTPLSFTVVWTPATDNGTPASGLTYAVYLSTTAALPTYPPASAQQVLDFTAGVVSYDVTALQQGTTYYANVFVTDASTSNHPPYELPESYHPHAVYAPKAVRVRIDNPVQARQRLWSYQYGDEALGHFFAQLPPQIFADTLFVITGDHDFRGLLKEDPTRVLIERRVPMIVLGPQLFADPPRHFTHTTSHRDVLPTLASLLGDAPVTSWGKSLFDTIAPSTVWSEEAFCRAQTCVYNGDVYAWQSDWRLVPLTQSVGTLMTPADEFFSSGAPPQ